MLEQCYNKETYTTSLPIDFNSLLKELPLGTKIIIFKENVNNHKFSEFNQPVDNLPSNLTHATFGELFNQSVDNLPQV